MIRLLSFLVLDYKFSCSYIAALLFFTASISYHTKMQICDDYFIRYEKKVGRNGEHHHKFAF